MDNYFTNNAELDRFIRSSRRGNIVLAHQNVDGYPGMVLYLGLHYNIDKPEYLLNLEWMSWGLDFYGDTLQESYQYVFHDLDTLSNYLHNKYEIKITDIQVKYTLNADLYPHVLKSSGKEEEYKLSWQRFQKDFADGKFLDPSLAVVYSSG